MMTNKEYVDILKHIASLPTYYCNKYPKNLGYYDGKKYSFDCWNLIKTVINRVGISGKWYDSAVGEYQKKLTVTGDVSGAVLLNRCTVKSQDFSKISYPGTYIFIRNSHAGTYIGETLINGKYYNVIECTAAWDKKVLYSWVDADGTRRRFKGSTSKSSKWTDWGLLPWINYTTNGSGISGSTSTSTNTTNTTNSFIYNKVDYSAVFNPTYYASKYPDLKKAFGTNSAKLFNHFCKYGMTEKRQAIATFNVDSYKARYTDLQKAFGNKYPEYYKHYCVYGKKEGRNAK